MGLFDAWFSAKHPASSPIPEQPVNIDTFDDLAPLHPLETLDVNSRTLTIREQNIILGNDTICFDAKKVYNFKYNIAPQHDYLEELFLPRYCSSFKYVFNPLQYGIINSLYGVSFAIYTQMPRIATGWRYFLQGVGLGIPYYFVNEVVTGILMRRLGKEQYFYSNITSAALTWLGYAGILGLMGKGRSRFNKVHPGKLKIMGNRILNICLTSMWLDILCIYQRDVILKRDFNLRPTFRTVTPTNEMIQQDLARSTPVALENIQQSKELLKLRREIHDEIANLNVKLPVHSK